jgi:hypothetical protein
MDQDGGLCLSPPPCTRARGCLVFLISGPKLCKAGVAPPFGRQAIAMHRRAQHVQPPLKPHQTLAPYSNPLHEVVSFQPFRAAWGLRALGGSHAWVDIHTRRIMAPLGASHTCWVGPHTGSACGVCRAQAAHSRRFERSLAGVQTLLTWHVEAWPRIDLRATAMVDSETRVLESQLARLTRGECGAKQERFDAQGGFYHDGAAFTDNRVRPKLEYPPGSSSATTTALQVVLGGLLW